MNLEDLPELKRSYHAGELPLMGWGPLWEPVLTVPEEIARLAGTDDSEDRVVGQEDPERGSASPRSPRQSPRSGVVAKVTTWLLDSVFGPTPQPAAAAAVAAEEDTWLQPLVGSSTEGNVLEFMERVDGVVNVPRMTAKERRKKRHWRDALLHATLEVQSACQSKMQTMVQTEMAQSALQNRWIHKIVDSPMVPMQLRHWGNFVLSPGTVETIHEDSAMSAKQMQRGTQHFEAPETSMADLADLLPRSSSAPAVVGRLKRNDSVDKSLCYLA
jgi:hypothetical protein